MVNSITRMVMIVLCGMLAGAVKAQGTYDTSPDGIGGYSTSGPNGYSSTTTPDGRGGWVTDVQPFPSFGYGTSYGYKPPSPASASPQMSFQEREALNRLMQPHMDRIQSLQAYAARAPYMTPVQQMQAMQRIQSQAMPKTQPFVPTISPPQRAQLSPRQQKAQATIQNAIRSNAVRKKSP